MDDLLGSVLNHGQDLVCSNFLVLFLIYCIEFSSLHDQVVHLELSRSSLNDLLFNGSLSHKPVHDYVLLLADSVSSINGLEINLRVPVRVKNDYDVGLVKVNAYSSSPS